MSVYLSSRAKTLTGSLIPIDILTLFKRLIRIGLSSWPFETSRRPFELLKIFGQDHPFFQLVQVQRPGVFGRLEFNDGFQGSQYIGIIEIRSFFQLCEGVAFSHPRAFQYVIIENGFENSCTQRDVSALFVITRERPIRRNISPDRRLFRRFFPVRGIFRIKSAAVDGCMSKSSFSSSERGSPPIHFFQSFRRQNDESDLGKHGRCLDGPSIAGGSNVSPIRSQAA